MGGQKRFLLSVAIFWALLILSATILVYSVLSANYWLLLIPTLFFGLVLYLTVFIRRDAAYVPTPEPIIKRMLELAEVKLGETLYDLGSGDGRILIVAARDFGAKAIGIEIDRRLVATSLQRLRAEKLEEKVKVTEGNFFTTNIGDADVVTLYLRQDTNNRLGAKFKRELKPGTRIVSYTFHITGWTPTKVDEKTPIYLYTV